MAYVCAADLAWNRLYVADSVAQESFCAPGHFKDACLNGFLQSHNYLTADRIQQRLHKLRTVVGTYEVVVAERSPLHQAGRLGHQSRAAHNISGCAFLPVYLNGRCETRPCPGCQHSQRRARRNCTTRERRSRSREMSEQVWQNNGATRGQRLSLCRAHKHNQRGTRAAALLYLAPVKQALVGHIVHKHARELFDAVPVNSSSLRAGASPAGRT